MRSDKMQMSYVPQCTEHITVTAMAANEDKYIDITVPPESIVEKIVYVVKNDFDQVVTVDAGHVAGIGVVADDDYFSGASPIDLNAANSETIYEMTTKWVPVASLPDRIIRFHFHNTTATASTGAVYLYAVYRFNANIHPTRVTNYA